MHSRMVCAELDIPLQLTRGTGKVAFSVVGKCLFVPSKKDRHSLKLARKDRSLQAFNKR